MSGGGPAARTRRIAPRRPSIGSGQEGAARERDQPVGGADRDPAGPPTCEAAEEDAGEVQQAGGADEAEGAGDRGRRFGHHGGVGVRRAPSSRGASCRRTGRTPPRPRASKTPNFRHSAAPSSPPDGIVPRLVKRTKPPRPASLKRRLISCDTAPSAAEKGAARPTAPCVTKCCAGAVQPLSGRAGGWRPPAYITAPTCQGTNSLSPRPRPSLLVFSPEATRRMVSRISAPFCWMVTPALTMSPQLMSMSSGIWA